MRRRPRWLFGSRGPGGRRRLVRPMVHHFTFSGIGRRRRWSRGGRLGAARHPTMAAAGTTNTGICRQCGLRNVIGRAAAWAGDIHGAFRNRCKRVDGLVPRGALAATIPHRVFTGFREDGAFIRSTIPFLSRMPRAIVPSAAYAAMRSGHVNGYGMFRAPQ